MHPQLSEERRKKCGDLITALEECHAAGYMNKVLGSCNEAAEALNKCLRAERKERAGAHLIRSRENRKKIEERWKKMEEEEFGPGGYLKQVLELEAKEKKTGN